MFCCKAVAELHHSDRCRDFCVPSTPQSGFQSWGLHRHSKCVGSVVLGKRKRRDGLLKRPMLKPLANSTVGATALGREVRRAIPLPARHAGSLTSAVREILVFKSLSINLISKRISHWQPLSGFSDSSRSPGKSWLQLRFTS